MHDRTILVISGGCFSLTDSNGRVLAKLFDETPKSRLAQFYTYGVPDFNVCERYYRVSDGEALNSFLHRGSVGGVQEKTAAAVVSGTTSSGRRIAKTPLNMLLRELVWRFGSWDGKQLTEWIDYVAPFCIFISVADSAFPLDFCRRIAKERNIPVILYSTEEYYFMTHENYMKFKFWCFKIKLP